MPAMMRVRLMGLDAPETHDRCPAETRLARSAHDRMATLVIGGVSLHPQGRDRQGRDVAAVLSREALARPYGGERRRSWCG
jgi:endonuclease YncB( thermonuclease family)